MLEPNNSSISSNTIARNSIVAVVQVMATTLVMFFLYSYLVRELGAEKMGVWSILMSAANSLRMGELGLSGSVVKFVAKYRALGDQDSAKRIIQTGFSTLLVFILIVLAIIYPILLWLFKYIFPDTSLSLAISLLPLALIYLWISTLGGVYQSGLDGCVRTDLHSSLILLGNIIVLLLAFILVPKFGLPGLFYAQMIQSIVVLIAAWYLLRKTIPNLPIITFKFEKKYLLEMLDYGYKVQIIGLIQILSDPLLKMLVGRFGGLEFSGYFDMALRLIQQIRSILLSANQTLVPVIAQLHETTSTKIKSVFKLTFSLISYFSIPIYFALILTAPLVSKIWIGSFVNQFVITLTILSIAEAVFILAGPVYFVYLGTGKLNWNLLSNLIGIVACLFLGWGFGFFLNGYGVIIGYGTSLIIKALVIIAPYIKENRILLSELFPPENKRMFFFGLIITIGYLVVYYGANLRDWIWISFLLALVALGLIGIVMWRHPLKRTIVLFIQKKIARSYAA